MQRARWIVVVSSLAGAMVLASACSSTPEPVATAPLPVGCNTDDECRAQNPRSFCAVERHLCLGCERDADCAAGSVCRGTACVPGCSAERGCADGAVCDVAKAACVQCVLDSHCKAPGANRCNPATNHCAACLPAEDSCPRGQVCDGTTCVSGCREDVDCTAGSPSPASQGKARCSASTHTCVGCTSECAAGSTCCATTCSNMLTDAKNCGGCGNVCATGEICCAGLCRKPEVPGLCVDCTKSCSSRETAAGDLGRATITDLVTDTTGAHTGSFPPRTPIVWIPMRGSNTVDMRDALTGDSLATPSSRGGRPVNGAVALDGSFWVANTCDDDPSNPRCSNVAQILADGSAGCTVGKAADGASLPFPRGLAVDASGFVWVGTWNDRRLHKIDPLTCKTVLDVTLIKDGTPSFPFAFAIDSKGLLWISTNGNGPTLTVDTKAGTIQDAVAGMPAAVGVAIDKQDNAYFGNASACNGSVYRVDGVSRAVTSSAAAPTSFCTRGVSVDTAGDVWASGVSGNVVKLTGGTGVYATTYAFPDIVGTNLGIAGDADGKVWMSGQTSGTALRFDAATGTKEMVRALEGSDPQNEQGDFTGLAQRSIVTRNGQAGRLSAVFEGTDESTLWTSVTWAAQVAPGGAPVRARFRAARSRAALATTPFCAPPGAGFFTSSPVDLGVCGFGQKQFLEVVFTLTTSDVAQVATLSGVKAYFQNPPLRPKGATCKDILDANPGAPSGVYTTTAGQDVYCDMTTAGGGWTLVLNLNTSDGHVMWWANPLWTDDRTYGNPLFPFASDYKGPAWNDYTGATKVLLTVHRRGSILGWKSFLKADGATMFTALQAGDNSLLGTAVIDSFTSPELVSGERLVRSSKALYANHCVQRGGQCTTGQAGSPDGDRIGSHEGTPADNNGGGLGSWHDMGYCCAGATYAGKVCKGFAFRTTAEAQIDWGRCGYGTSGYLGTDTFAPATGACNDSGCGGANYSRPSGLDYDYALYLSK